MATQLGKGARVRVVSGRSHVGSVGTVFWTGPDKYDPDHQRLGVRADDGETIWVSEKVVDAVSGDAPAPAPAGPPPNKGARVRWRNRGEEGEGTVFWVGASKSGPGHRVGVRLDDQEEPLWLDGRQVEVIATPPSATTALPPGARPRPAQRRADLDDDDLVDSWADGAEPAGDGFFDDDAPVDERFAPVEEDE